MATNSNWTVIMDDKKIIKQTGDAAGTPYVISDDSFWSQSKYANIWAIQHGNSVTSNEVEYRDDTPHSSFADADIGNIQDFIDKWDSTHLATLQSNWDSNSQDESIKGPRPTSYSS